MGAVNANTDTILQLYAKVKNAITSIDTTKISILKKYQELGNSWKDKKYQELGNVVCECKKALNDSLEVLHKGEKYLQALVFHLREYEDVEIFSSQETMNSVTNAVNYQNVNEIDIDGCNCAFERDGYSVRMFDISNICVDGANDENFWNHHNQSYWDWQRSMLVVPKMLNEYASGMSIDECYDHFPTAAPLIFGRNAIRITPDSQGLLSVSDGRHRIAMAHQLGITWLPALVY